MFVLVTIVALLRVQFVISTSNPTFIFSSTWKENKQHHNLPTLLTTLTSQTSKTRFYNSSFGEAQNQLYGLYLCRGDLDHQSCSDCVNYAKNHILSKSLNSTKALFWFEQCMVRYSHEPISGKVDDYTWSSSWTSGNLTCNQIRFAEILGDTMNELAWKTANDYYGKKFATKIVTLNSFESLYVMGQCTWDLTPSDCNKCLSKAIGKLSHGAGSKGDVFGTSCMVRYETFPFLNTLNLLESQPSLSMSQ